jgi:imidazole glycerol-phosphate synthase subunit HisH
LAVGRIAGTAVRPERESARVITVIDYDAGNGPSVVAALEHLGHACRLASSEAALSDASHIVLPGVGSAQATLDSLAALGLTEPLTRRVRAGVPFLGICVGLQILFEHSEEDDAACLGWFPGKVRRFSHAGLRVPLIGWNPVQRLRAHPLLEGLPETAHFYFVNSYFATPEDESVLLCRSEYGTPFAAMVAKDNVTAAQFHIEKSGPLGLRILDNFARSNGA